MTDLDENLIESGPARDRSAEFVQAILVPKVTAASHEDVVAAVAVAASLAWLQSPAGDPSWVSWLSEAFTKTVRRTRTPAAAAAAAATSVTVGAATAYAFTPTRYRDLPTVVARAQVAGLNYARSGWCPLPAPGTPTPRWVPAVVVNPDVEPSLTTGKTAAQVAHCLMMRLIDADRDTRAEWAATPAVHVFTTDRDSFRGVAHGSPAVVQDAGFTEVRRGTVTCCAVT